MKKCERCGKFLPKKWVKGRNAGRCKEHQLSLLERLVLRLTEGLAVFSW